jgi:uncharacterized YccA/Bax inhibitor family protein
VLDCSARCARSAQIARGIRLLRPRSQTEERVCSLVLSTAARDPVLDCSARCAFADRAIHLKMANVAHFASRHPCWPSCDGNAGQHDQLETHSTFKARRKGRCAAFSKLFCSASTEAPDQEATFMLRSSNPILSRQDAFTPAAQQYNQNPYNQSRADYAQYPAQGYPQAPVEPIEARMTFDDVVTKTALTIGVLVIAAALAWMFVPQALYFPALIGSGLIGFIVVLFVSFRRKIAPGLVLLYAAIEGIFIGMISKIFESLYDGIVVQAVIGTFAAAAVTLAAYKFFNIRVTPKFRRVVIIATIAFAVALLINFVLSLFGVNLGLRDTGTGAISLLAIAFSLLGASLAVLNLVLDFDYIEQGVAMGAPASESWRGAFGLTVTMVWLYIEILRLLSYIRR